MDGRHEQGCKWVVGEETLRKRFMQTTTIDLADLMGRRNMQRDEGKFSTFSLRLFQGHSA